MGNTLAYTIIDGHKGAFRLHPLHDSLREEPDIDKKRADEGVWQLKERLDVALYDEQGMACEERTVVEERQRNIVLKNFETRNDAPNDVAKDAAFLEHGFEYRRIFHLGIGLP